MVLQLVKDQFGNYTYQSPSTQLATNIASDAQAFEAYQSAQKTTLAGGTDIGGETQKLLQRELPGQQELVIDPTTGQAKAKGEIEQVDVTPSITSLETSTSLATQPKETPIDIATRIASLTQRQGTSTGVDVGALISKQQKLMKRQQDIGLISSGLNAYAAYKGYGMMTAGGTIGGGAMSTAPITQLTQLGTTPIGASTIGGVGIAGAAGYGLGKVIGAKEKEAQGMGAGAAIGMAVGGPVGAVIGGAAGGILGGSVICTELKRQGLITNEDYNIHWKYTLNKWNKEDLKGYWIWANPMANKMKTNKTLTKFWYHIMKNKMQYVKYTLGKDKFNLKGLIYNTLIEQGSLLISKFLKFKKTNEVLA